MRRKIFVAGALFGTVIVATPALYIALAFVISAVSIGRGWVSGPEGALQPGGGQWLGFQMGQDRRSALSNACALVASGEITAVDFACPVRPDQPTGLNIADVGQAPEELWKFKPHLAPWQLQCLGLEPEQLTVGVTGGRVDALYVDCGVRSL
jgi:hypothetical protein